MQRTLMIDGDIVLFQVGRVTEDVTDFGDILLESYDEEACIRLLDNELEKIAEKTGYSLDEMVFAISSTVVLMMLRVIWVAFALLFRLFLLRNIDIMGVDGTRLASTISIRRGNPKVTFCSLTPA